eukprot:955130-Alexandrium_andersonii.AAC.1
MFGPPEAQAKGSAMSEEETPQLAPGQGVLAEASRRAAARASASEEVEEVPVLHGGHIGTLLHSLLPNAVVC